MPRFRRPPNRGAVPSSRGSARFKAAGAPSRAPPRARRRPRCARVAALYNSRQRRRRLRVIEFEQAGFSYGAQPVLHDVTLTLAPGGSTSSSGPSGAGKTTLLRLVLSRPRARPPARCASSAGASRRGPRRDRRPAPGGRGGAPGLPLPRPPAAWSRTSPCRSRSAASTRAARAEDLAALLEWVDLADRVARAAGGAVGRRAPARGAGAGGDPEPRGDPRRRADRRRRPRRWRCGC